MVCLSSQSSFAVLRERNDVLRGVVDDNRLQALLQRLFLFLYAESAASGDLVLHHGSHEDSVKQLLERVPAYTSERRPNSRYEVPLGPVVDAPVSVSVHLVLLPSHHKLLEIVFRCVPISGEEWAGTRVVDCHR